MVAQIQTAKRSVRFVRSARAASVRDDPRWAAVTARDAAADGTFLYSVATTGVYCRPSCGARRPRPEHVEFHASRMDAERAGFRACRRCRPDRPSQAERDAELVAAACRIIDAAETPPALDELAKRIGLSRHHFHRLFKRSTGLTPRGYAAARREERLRESLVRGAGVTEAIAAAGYGSSSRFYEQADAVLGMTATRYRERGAGSTIRYALADCALGHVLVAATERGVCAILLGDDPAALIGDLEQRFGRAEARAAHADLAAHVAAVVRLVDTPRRGLDLPLDIRGTVFQRRVWQALRDVPAGTTVSYADLAMRIGAPRAARAVAGACAANPLAVAIPCHRVVGADGSLSGYRWGAERKRALLERERGVRTEDDA